MKRLLLFIIVLVFGLCLFPSSAAADYTWGGEQGYIGGGIDGSMNATPKDEDPWDINIPEDVDGVSDTTDGGCSVAAYDPTDPAMYWIIWGNLYPEPF